jgi:chromosome segregation ATPase
MQFPEVFRSLRATLFALERRIITADDELLEALSSISEKESGVVALVLDWSLKQQIESRNQFDALDRRHSITTQELTEAREQLMQVTTHADRLSKQLGEERAAGEQLHKEIGVAKTHGQADLEDLRSLALKTLRDALSQLAVVSEALKRDPPKIQSALDKVEAVMDRLKSANDNLEET